MSSSPPPLVPFLVPAYQPRFPTGTRLPVAILGCGNIALNGHLPAYEKYGVEVAGVWSLDPATSAEAVRRFPRIGRVYGSAEELLADEDVAVVDIATPTEGRVEWIARAVAAGKHVLAQKPLALDLAALAPVLDRAAQTGVTVAVNQNGRWAPPWRLASLLVQDGAIGEVVAVTHLHDKPLPPIAGTAFDDVEHMLVVDYLMHWIDITRCWLAGKEVDWVRARDARVPGQPAEAKNPWSASVEVQCSDGARASLTVLGDVRTRRPSCPFWIHGTEGTIRGSVLLGSDRLELERGDTATTFALDGQWFVDGFAGTMGELMCAVVEGRSPDNSADHNLASLELMLAARTSARQGGTHVPVPGLVL